MKKLTLLFCLILCVDRTHAEKPLPLFTGALSSFHTAGKPREEMTMREIVTYVLEDAEKFWPDYLREQDLPGDRGDIVPFGYEAFPVLYELMSANLDSPAYAWEVMYAFVHVDGHNITSAGDKEALALAREVASRNLPSADSRVPARWALIYLGYKGNESDIGLLEKVQIDDPKNTGEQQAAINALQARTVGNLLGRNMMPAPWSYGYHHAFTYENRIYFMPSIANTGPQAIYVYEILKKALEMAGNDPSKIPHELITMTVTLDENLQNPVSSVDLAKYGLSMPSIPLEKGKPITEYTATFPHETKTSTTTSPKNATVQKDSATPTSPNQPETSPPTKTEPPHRTTPFLWLSIIVIIIIGIGGFYVWRKKR